MVKGDGEGPYRAGPVYVWVSADDEAAAREVVEAVRSGAYRDRRGLRGTVDDGSSAAV